MTRRWHPGLVAAGMLAGLLVAAPGLAASFTSGSTGADGPFTPTCAPTPCTVTIPLPPAGVFHHTTGTVPAGVTVKFARNAANTPVTLLFQGDVTIAGTLNVDGASGSAGAIGTSFVVAGGASGPGGFDGGAGGNSVAVSETGGIGLGPGGGGSGAAACLGGAAGAGGGFGTGGGNGNCGDLPAGGNAYGNPQLLPLLGGSGGGGGEGPLGLTGGAGGGGAGALLIASSGTLTLTGTLSAVGGGGGAVPAGAQAGNGGGGAGGAVRLVATTLTGTGGTINVTGGIGSGTGFFARGGVGRIRLEAFTNTLTVNLGGVVPSVGVPGAVFPSGLPTLAIASVGGIAAPASPAGSFTTPDITLPSTATSPVTIVVTATNVPAGTPIVLRAKPQTGAAATATTPGLSGTLAASSASADLALDLTQPNVLSAAATFQLAAGDVPIAVARAAGPADPVTHARVAAAFGSASRVVYITRSGRELAP